MKRILSLVGTRPELIKNLPLFRAARNFANLQFLICHTGQNFGSKMDDEIACELGIEIAVRNRTIDRTSRGSIAKDLMNFVELSIDKFKPDWIISNTDTDSAFFTALCGSIKRIPVGHIEGGIRCEAKKNPEEINRRLADQLSDIIFTITPEDSQSLFQEGFSESSVHMVGDITLDALQIVLNEHQIPVKEGNYNLLTVHRQENTGNDKHLLAIIEAIEACGIKTIFPVHPRTYDALKRTNFLERLSTSKVIELRESLSYLKFVKLLAGCRKVISDSGGLRREGYMLGKPVISLVDFVWFKKMNQLGFEYSAGADFEKICWAIKHYHPKEKRPPIFGDGRAAYRILEVIQNHLLG